MIETLSVASTLVLGLFAGGMLTEALLLVPYFRSLDHGEFHRLHGAFGPRLYRYYAPLTLAANLAPLLASVAITLVRPQDSLFAWTATALGFAILATYPLYFRRANRAFAEQTLDEAALGPELSRWSRVHGFRTALALAAFLASVLSLFALGNVG